MTVNKRMNKKRTNNNSNPLLSVQKAAEFLDVNPGTIRRWARDKQIKGLKVGTRGDWRFTKDELENALRHDTEEKERKKIVKVKKIISKNAYEIQRTATKHHKKLLGTPRLRNEFADKYINSHIEAVKEFVKHLDDIDKGVPTFKKLGEKLAKDALHDGLTLEEAVDGTIFLKQAVWNELETEGMLEELTTENFYHISQIIGTYSDVLASTVAFTYHDYFEQQEKRSEKRFRILVEESSDAVVLNNTKGEITYASPSIEKLLGYKPKELLGKNPGNMIHPDDVQNAAALFQKVLKKPNRVEKIQYRLKHKQKGWRWMEGTLKNMLRDPIILATVINVRDIHEQKEFEEKLLYLAGLTNSMSDAVISTDVNYTILTWNKGAEELYGLKATDVIGKNAVGLFNSEFMDTVASNWRHMLATKGSWKGEVTQQKKDGSRLYVHSIVSAVNDVTGKTIGYVTVNRDIAEQKKASEKLQEQAKLLQMANDAFIVQDNENKIVSWNKGAEKVYGFSEKESLGKKAMTLLKTVLPDSLDEIQGVIKKQGVWTGELQHTTKSGRQVIVDSRWVLLRDGKSPQYLEVNRDITERVKIEKQREEFISIASHELKTPVTSLKAYGQVLQARFAKKDEEHSVMMLSKMDAQINKLNNLITDLLDVSKIEGGRLQFQNNFFSFDELVHEIVEEVQRTTEKHTITVYGKTGRKIYGDRDRIGQVIINLLTNAIKYSPQSDKVIVTSLATKKEVKVCVQDFGVGIPKDKLPHVFERFYRVPGKTHDTVPGMGIGLYISSEIVKRQGGSIWAESIQGESSTFCFTLPVKRDEDTKK